VIAAIEWQEARGRPPQLRRHVNFAVAYGEVDERTARQAEQRLGPLPLRLRVAVEPVLVDGVFDPLGKVRLQFGRGDGDAVQEQHEIDAVLVMLRVLDLPHDAQAIGLILFDDVRVCAESRLELCERERLSQTDHLDAVAKHVERAALVHLLADTVEQHGLGGSAVVLRERVPSVLLGRLKPSKEIGGEKST